MSPISTFSIDVSIETITLWILTNDLILSTCQFPSMRRTKPKGLARNEIGKIGREAAKRAGDVTEALVAP